ncbi:MAG: glycoside hydrolase family 25 protein [Oscillospiraceae bacterium]|jgi:GH25 family lysozyme M1 (1,4-beta-N-acetylmuramidase)|nr:glycoside hydrolase family 25 protein [Oscillospiraceae bacterium]
MAIKKFGIDISTWQNGFDLRPAKKAGLDFVIIRAGFGREASQKDKKMEVHYKNARAAGLKVGWYWYSYATDAADAVKEAKACLEVIKGKTAEYPIYFDIEDPTQTSLSKATLTANTKAFCDTIEAAGYEAGVYSFLSFLLNKQDYNVIKNYSIWVAQWGVSAQRFGKPVDMWQYTSDGSVAGYSGRLDCNYAYIDPTTNLKSGSTPAPSKPVTPSKPATQANGNIDVFYRVKTQGGGWLPEVKNLTDYAGLVGEKITDVAIKVSSGFIKYRIHCLNGNWLPYVTGYNTKDYNNGYAGNGSVIDAIQIDFTPPSGSKKQIYYKVAPVKSSYFENQVDISKSNGMDGYAGLFGKAIDRLQMQIK